ncbi:anti-sigma-28 factor, FlgM family [Kosakonia arachidis]|uniref:Negative regulator of flagellin synthesis n=1 Tax=Kosakonia arachidis TaxID=551989 RepID=A0A1I7E8P7_9ENTR|nr:flagellar biosynthesis anti-sigma factor FlgM [Kosakonia arachidis]SFU20272.1 anti-sigma-28 factor, FlgM family [Kosakonia arachidis]
MSINRTQLISPTTLTGIHQESAKRTGRGTIQVPSATTRTRTDTKVNLSNQIQSLKTDDSQDLDIEKLEQIKAALNAGEHSIDTDKISASLVRDMFQLC